MIRAVWIAALITLLMTVLYIPSVTPPERFLEIVRIEHRFNQAVWGAAAADRILARMLDLQAGTGKVSTPPVLAPVTGQRTFMETAVAAQVSEASRRLFNNAYFRSIDALFVLASFRLAGLMETLHLIAAFASVAILDGAITRMVRSKELIQHSPEMFALHICAALVMLGGIALVTITPCPIHPLWLVAAMLASNLSFSRAMANVHRSG